MVGNFHHAPARCFQILASLIAKQVTYQQPPHDPARDLYIHIHWRLTGGLDKWSGLLVSFLLPIQPSPPSPLQPCRPGPSQRMPSSPWTWCLTWSASALRRWLLQPVACSGAAVAPPVHCCAAWAASRQQRLRGRPWIDPLECRQFTCESTGMGQSCGF